MTEESSAPNRSRFDPLSTIWHVLAASQTLVVLIGVLVLVLLLGTLFPQLSSSDQSKPLYQVATQTKSLLQPSAFTRFVGLHEIYHSPWLYLPLVLIGLCILVRAVDSAEIAWRAAGVNRWTCQSFSVWGARAQQATVIVGRAREDLPSTVRSCVLDLGYWWSEVQGSVWPNAVVGKRSLVLWARPTGYAAVLAALVGIIVVGNWGWTLDDWRPIPGESLTVGHSTAYTVRLDSFQVQTVATGREPGVSGTLSWLENGSVQDEGTFTAGRPATFRGVAVRQVGFTPDVVVTAWDDDGRLLELQAESEASGVPEQVEVSFPAADAQPILLIPSRDRAIVLSLDPRCSQGHPTLHLSLVKENGSDWQYVGAVQDSGTLEADGLRFQADLTFRPILRIDYLPGMWIVVGSMVLGLAALLAGWLAPARLAWIAIGAGESDASAIQILVPAGARGRRWLHRLAGQLQEALSTDD